MAYILALDYILPAPSHALVFMSYLLRRVQRPALGSRLWAGGGEGQWTNRPHEALSSLSTSDKVRSLLSQHGGSPPTVLNPSILPGGKKRGSGEGLSIKNILDFITQTHTGLPPPSPFFFFFLFLKPKFEAKSTVG